MPRLSSAFGTYEPLNDIQSRAACEGENAPSAHRFAEDPIDRLPKGGRPLFWRDRSGGLRRAYRIRSVKAVNQASFQSRVGFEIELLYFRRFLRGLINWSTIYPLLTHGDSPRFLHPT